MQFPKVDLHLRKSWQDRVFFILLVVSAALRLLWLDYPKQMIDNGTSPWLISDEVYYVNAARNILGLQQHPNVYTMVPKGIDPNMEHPPLAKLIMAFSMKVIGNNPWGWRLPSVFFGLLCIIVLYLLLKKIAKNQTIALLGTFLFSFDTLVFVLSRVGTLDIYVLAFMLLGFYWYFSGNVKWSAFSMGLATLCKMGGLYGAITLLAFHLVKTLVARGRKVDWRGLYMFLLKYVIVYMFTFLLILVVADWFIGYYKNPFDQLSYIYVYTSTLTPPFFEKRIPTQIWGVFLQWLLGQRASCYNPNLPLQYWSYPWEWLIDQQAICYTTFYIGPLAGTINFMGIINPAILALTVPSMIYSLYSYYKTREDYPLFVLLWFAVTYLSFIPMELLTGRIMYIYYFLNTVPAVTAAIAYMFIKTRTPKPLIILYLIVVVVCFWALFPFKAIP